jgi:hypothetical protein
MYIMGRFKKAVRYSGFLVTYVIIGFLFITNIILGWPVEIWEVIGYCIVLLAWVYVARTYKNIAYRNERVVVAMHRQDEYRVIGGDNGK